MTNPNDLIRRGELQRRVDLFCAFMIGAGYAAFVDRARQMVSEILSDIPAIPAAPDTPEVLALVEALRFYAEGHWSDDYPGGVKYDVYGVTHLDYGNKATAALAAWEASRDR